jgi:hypothetical protein
VLKHQPLPRSLDDPSLKNDKKRFNEGSVNEIVGVKIPSEILTWDEAHAHALANQTILDEDRFVQLVAILSSSFDLSNYSEFFEKIEETVVIRHNMKRKPLNMNSALSVKSVLDGTLIPRALKDGDTELSIKLRRLGTTIVDPNVGVNLVRNLDFYKLKDEFCSNAQSMNNLIFTRHLHCPGDRLKLSAESQKCQVHDINFMTEKAEVKEAEVDSFDRSNFIPLDFVEENPPNGVLAHVKPLLASVTQAAMVSLALVSSLSSYFATEAKRITSSYTALPANIQMLLESKYPDLEKIPTSLVQSLLGKDLSAASAIIHSKKEETVKPKKTEAEVGSGVLNEILERLKQLETKPKAAPSKAPKQGNRHGYPTSFTAKQDERLFKSFGTYKQFLNLKKTEKLKGKLDLMKLANFFKGGVKTSKKTSAEIVKACSLN